MKWDRTKRGNVNLVQQYMSAGMSPAAAVEKAYPSWPAAKKQQLIAQMSGAPKTAGYISEIAGQLVNPGNWFGVTPAITGGVALDTPTRSSKEQAAADEVMWKNLLIPGVAPYHAWKRLGYSIRGKELKEERERRKKKKSDEKEHDELERWQMTVEEDDPDIDEKGRRLKKLQDDDAKDKEHVKLAAPYVPGAPFEGGTGEYTDTTFDGPTLPTEWAAGAPDSRAKLLDHIKYMLAGGVGGATLGGLAGGGAAAGGAIGGLYGLLSDPGKDEKGKRRSRLMRALKGIVYGGGLGALGGLAGGAGAALGGYYGGKSGLRFGDRAFSERSASAMRTTNRDKEAEAACRVISKVTSLVKDPKKHKWLDDSREGFGHWAGPPSVAKGDTEPKNVKEAQKPLGEEDLDLYAPNNPVPRGHLDPAIADRTLAAQMNDLQGLPPSAYQSPAYDPNRQIRYKEDAAGNFIQDRTPVPGIDMQFDEMPGLRHPGPVEARTNPHSIWFGYKPPVGERPGDALMGNIDYRLREGIRQHALRKPKSDPSRAQDLRVIDNWFGGNTINPNNPSPGGVPRRYEHEYRPRGAKTDRTQEYRISREGNLIKTNAAKHDCDKAHPGLTHKEWKALKGQRHDIQKSAGVSREALGAILGALLGGAGGYHMANQMAEPGSMMPRFGPDGKLLPAVNPGLPGNWREGLIGAAATGIPSAALGGYIGRALTPKEEEEEE